MPESLLTPTDILLFGRTVSDLSINRMRPADATRVDVLSTRPIGDRVGLLPGRRIDGIELVADCVVLIASPEPGQNGVYTVQAEQWTGQEVNADDTFFVEQGDNYADSLWRAVAVEGGFRFEQVLSNRTRGNRLLQSQLNDERAHFARIYGFSYQGSYFDLPTPVLFLVHNEGIELTPDALPPNFSESRAPHGPTYSGVGAADFQFSDDIRVWSYDKADWTIRMDVDTGTFEQMLLDIYFSGDDGSPLMVSGGRVSGGRVSGGRVSGGRVSGGRVSGGRVSGGRAKGPSD